MVYSSTVPSPLLFLRYPLLLYLFSVSGSYQSLSSSRYSDGKSASSREIGHRSSRKTWLSDQTKRRSRRDWGASPDTKILMVGGRSVSGDQGGFVCMHH
ncbi:hypothetical protein GGI35DRAFT_189117 [Trichoderma velutinum]